MRCSEDAGWPAARAVAPHGGFRAAGRSRKIAIPDRPGGWPSSVVQSPGHAKPILVHARPASAAGSGSSQGPRSAWHWRDSTGRGDTGAVNPQPVRLSQATRTPGDHSWLFCASEPAHGRVQARVSIRQGDCGITSWLACRPVTLGYPESDHQHPEAGVPGCPCRSARQVQGGSCEPHRNPTSPRHGGRSPQESHGRNGTLRYTCYAC